MNYMIRRLAGKIVAAWYSVNGRRRRLLENYNRTGTCLAIVGHDPNGENLEKLLKWFLNKGFSFIIPSKVGTMQRGRSAWLSFDDGWQSFKTTVLPVLERLQIPATVFIAPHETIQGQLWTNGTREVLGQDRIREMYSMPWKGRQPIVDEVLRKTGNPRRLMTKEDVIELSRHPLVDIQNHTMTHLSCSHRPVEEVLAEVKEANRVLKEWTGKECTMVCYPFCHATAETDRAIRSIGMIPVRGNAGEGTLAEIGMTRNMFKDHASLQENIGRALNAWCKVSVGGR